MWKFMQLVWKCTSVCGGYLLSLPSGGFSNNRRFFHRLNHSRAERKTDSGAFTLFLFSFFFFWRGESLIEAFFASFINCSRSWCTSPLHLNLYEIPSFWNMKPPLLHKLWVAFSTLKADKRAQQYSERKRKCICVRCVRAFSRLLTSLWVNSPLILDFKKNLLRQKKKKIYRCIFFLLLLLFLTCRCASRVAWEVFFFFFLFLRCNSNSKTALPDFFLLSVFLLLLTVCCVQPPPD